MIMKTQEGESIMDQRRREVLHHIGKRIKHHRRELGYSRDEVAELVGITPRTLAAYERGEREMSMEMAIELARIYKTTLTKLTDYKYVIGMML